MKDLFPAFYQISEDETKKVWDEGTFIFDTNILLNLYRYDEKAREDYFLALQAISDRLWIPHQVALEFQFNRSTVIKERALVPLRR